MDIFDLLSLLGGLSLFLFGMNVMGQSLERRAGSGLRSVECVFQELNTPCYIHSNIILLIGSFLIR